MSDAIPLPAFTLYADEVPDPPSSGAWTSVLRWMICVMNPGDTRLPFIARCLAVAIERGGLHPTDHDSCLAISAAVMRDYAAGILICQNTEAPESAPISSTPSEPEQEPDPSGSTDKKRLH